MKIICSNYVYPDIYLLSHIVNSYSVLYSRFSRVQTVGVTCFRVIAISIAFVTPDQQIVSFSLSLLSTSLKLFVCIMIFLCIIWLLYSLTVCFLIGQMIIIIIPLDGYSEIWWKNSYSNMKSLTSECISLKTAHVKITRARFKWGL